MITAIDVHSEVLLGSEVLLEQCKHFLTLYMQVLPSTGYLKLTWHI